MERVISQPPPRQDLLPPPPGPPTPSKGGNGKVLVGVGITALVLIIGVSFFVLPSFITDQGGSFEPGSAEDNSSDTDTDPGAEGSDDAQTAEVGDCTTEMDDPSASDVIIVSCDSDDAFFEIVGREDDPSSSDAWEVADEVCTGTMATNYISQRRGDDLDWLMCLDPIHIKTAKWGAVPGKVGQCWVEKELYQEIVDCDDSSAHYKVVYAEQNPVTTASLASQAVTEVCKPHTSTVSPMTDYWSEFDESPFGWYLCLVEEGHPDF